MRLEILLNAVLIFSHLNTEALDNGLALTPPMGWITYRYTGLITDCDAFPDECLRYFSWLVFVVFFIEN